MACRACFSGNLRPFVDLGCQPPSNDYAHKGKFQYPLKVEVCENCGLGQMVHDVPPRDIFNYDYAYFSAMSPSWVADRRALAARMINMFALQSSSLVIDIGGNDGYYLEHLQPHCRVLNYEPAESVARVSREKGIETVTEFWGSHLDTAPLQATLINATNVLAHTPDMNSFITAVRPALALDGVVTFEFPLFSNLIEHNQLDTIYHEHYSYISVGALRTILERHGMRIWRIEELATHGGSVRVFASERDSRYCQEESVARIETFERWAPNADFESKAQKVKWDLLGFLAEARTAGRIIGYSAPAKATVLANYVGLDTSVLDLTVDDSPAKQGQRIPGTNIPIVPFDKMDEGGVPAYILLFAWNLLEPIKAKLSKHYHELRPNLRPRLVTAIPELRVTNI
jgi:hypothetical protein